MSTVGEKLRSEGGAGRAPLRALVGGVVRVDDRCGMRPRSETVWPLALAHLRMALSRSGSLFSGSERTALLPESRTRRPASIKSSSASRSFSWLSEDRSIS